ncbi:hypothetical protein PENSPDRAFT_684838 [Peniophora sp. CONT]|nr:hypothetical protein PENSPDRAFT_684838 [Peniophora sp. CONT]
MAPHPNLRHAIFWNMFIPFSLPNLVSLQLLCSKFGEGIRTIPQAWLDSMLDSLESCSALIDLRIMHYILPSPSTQRRITVPHLESLSCTDSSVFDILHLPALRRVKAPIEVQAPADQAAPSLRTGLSAIFGRYGLSPRSLNISQREGRTPQHPSALFVRLGGEPLGYPPSPSLPLDWSSFTLEEPGPFVSFAFGIHRETGTRALSLLFSEYTRVVHSIPGTDTIDTLAFDNETREHTFDREDGFISPATTQEPVWGLSLPSFPAVRKIVLPFRDNDTIYHIISSLVTDENCLHLPQLSCLSFNGPLHMAHTFMEIYPALASLLRVRAAPVMGVLPMTSLEFELFVDGALALLEDADDWIEPLRRTLAKAVRSGLGDRASITIQQEYAVADSGSGFPYFRLLATITYDT